MSYLRSSSAERAEALLICKHAARIVGRAREVVPDYGKRSAPVGSSYVAQLLRHSNCTLTFRPIDEGCAGMTLPPVGGIYTVIINRDDAEVDDWLTIRHELGHVLAADVEEPTYLDSDEMSWTERVADLFALADVVPAGMIRNYQRPGRPRWGELLRSLQDLVGGFAPGWSETRVKDRAWLRLKLYRTQGI